MSANQRTTKRPVGRPFIGNKKVTLRLSPAMVAALGRAAPILGLNKSELTERALRDYLHKAAEPFAG